MVPKGRGGDESVRGCAQPVAASVNAKPHSAPRFFAVLMSRFKPTAVTFSSCSRVLRQLLKLGGDALFGVVIRRQLRGLLISGFSLRRVLAAGFQIAGQPEDFAILGPDATRGPQLGQPAPVGARL